MAIDPTSLAARSGLLGSTFGVESAGGGSGTGTSGAAKSAAAGSSAVGDAVTSAFGLGKDDFFKLFLAQLSNQDPTNPVDDKDFLNQLAQFSMIDTLQQVQKSLGGTQLAQASGLLGKTVSGSDTDGKVLTGKVDQIIQNSGEIYLIVGGRSMSPDAVSIVSPDQAATPA